MEGRLFQNSQQSPAGFLKVRAHTQASRPLDIWTSQRDVPRFLPLTWGHILPGFLGGHQDPGIQGLGVGRRRFSVGGIISLLFRIFENSKFCPPPFPFLLRYVCVYLYVCG